MAQNPQAFKDKRVALLMTHGIEQIKYTSPRRFLAQHGAHVTLVSPNQAGEDIQGCSRMPPGDKFKVEKNVSELKGGDYHVVVPLGGGPTPINCGSVPVR